MAGSRNLKFVFLFGLILLLFAGKITAQRLAIIDPVRTQQSERIAQRLTDSLSTKIQLVDWALAASAFSSLSIEDPYNLSTDESKRIGAAIGCNAFLLIKTETLRRTSSERQSYFESYAVLFLVGAKHGHLVWSRMINWQTSTAAGAEGGVLAHLDEATADIAPDWKQLLDRDDKAEPDPNYPEVPAEGSPEAKNFRGPIPYLRIKPEYTQQAFLYGAKGTVEIAVDLDEKGNVVRTEIERWVGFGLDEAVTDAVRKMNWRPAERAGKPLPMRFLLRYNFKKVDTE